jgi:peptide/nickel transport system permease protein
MGRKYLTRKGLHALATLAFVLAVNFFLFRIMPGDPIRMLARGSATHMTPQRIAEIEHEQGLDRPLPQQFVVYVSNTLQGKFGTSFVTDRPVMEPIAHAFWPTVLLVGSATLLSTLFGLWAGIRGAWRRGSVFDTTSLFGSLILYSAPEGWLGMLLLILFAGTTVHWFPTGQLTSNNGSTGIAYVGDVAYHLFLPCMTLTLGYIGEYHIIMRSSLLEVMSDDFVMTARAKGVPDRLVRRRHAVPNALLPSLTLVFYSFGFVLGGSIIIEQVYSWPGLGRLEYRAIQDLDYNLLQALFLIASAAVILFNLAADILYGYLDPRVREG